MKAAKKWFGFVAVLGFAVTVSYVRPSAQSDVMPFSADMTVRRSAVGSEGQPSSMGEMRFHYERVRRRGHWQTEFTLLPAEPQKNLPPGIVGKLPSSLEGARVEDDGSGELRVIDASGRELKLPILSELQGVLGSHSAAGGAQSPVDAIRAEMAGRGQGSKGRPVPGDNWLSGTVLRMDQGAARLSRVEKKFRRAGQVRGLQRVLVEDNAETTELLVDTGLGVTLEANTLDRGVLTAHSTFTYQQEATGRLLKTKSRTERLASDGRSHSVFEIEWTNIRLGAAAGGQR